ncbi:MAG: RICIN domain-containing protein [Clostridia bacterium]|nr:RICIN domain-containing protein [Clostridia bacterium]
MTADTTVYPVYIDPSFNVGRQYIQDTYIASGYTNNYVNASLVAVGYGSNAKNVRTVAKITNLYGGNAVQGKITSAYYSMYCTSNYSSSPKVDVYVINPDITWNPATATWQNSADLIMNNSVKISSLTVGGAGRYNFDITAAYQSWQMGSVNNGLMFRMTTEVSGKYRQFSSANVSTSTNIAYITVTYDLSAIGIQLSPTSAYMAIGETKQIASLVYPTELAELSWESSNPGIAAVSQTGLVTAVSEGTAIITARSVYNTAIFAICNINVYSQAVTGVDINDEELHLNIGSEYAVTASVSPGNATFKEVIWQSNNQSVATISSTGVITAIAAGTATITVTTRHGHKVDTVDVVVHPQLPNGEYYVKNRGAFLYMDTQNQSTTVSANIQQEKFHGDDSQVWIFTLQSNGYYTISSKNSNMCLSINGDATATGTTVVQSPYVGNDKQLWSVEVTPDGTYKIIPKSGELQGMALATASTNRVAGVDIQQKIYVDDINRTDEWSLYQPQYIAYVDSYYDTGYLVRYGDDALNNIIEAQNIAERIFIEACGLKIVFSEPQYYQSLPDKCKETVTMENLNVMCSNEEHIKGTNGNENYYCTNRTACFSDFPGTDSPIETNVLWTGHRIESYAADGTKDYNRSASLGTEIMMLCESGYDLTFVHELIHQYSSGVHYYNGKYVGIDHYHETISAGNNEICLHADICSDSECNPNGRPSDCVMNYANGYSDVLDGITVICDDCNADIKTHLEQHHRMDQMSVMSTEMIIEESGFVDTEYAEPPNVRDLEFKSTEEIKEWLATAEGRERYKTVYDDLAQDCRDNIDRLIKEVRENGILIPQFNNEDVSVRWRLHFPVDKDTNVIIYCHVTIDDIKYTIMQSRIEQEYKQYARMGYLEYIKAYCGRDRQRVAAKAAAEKGEYKPISFYSGENKSDEAFFRTEKENDKRIYSLIDGREICLYSWAVTDKNLVQKYLDMNLKTESVYADGHFDEPQDLEPDGEIPQEQQDNNDASIMRTSGVLYIIIAVLVVVGVVLTVLLVMNKNRGAVRALVSCVIIVGVLLSNAVLSVVFINCYGMDYTVSAEEIYNTDEYGYKSYNLSGIVEPNKPILPTKKQAEGLEIDMSLDKAINTVGKPQKLYVSKADGMVFEFVLRDGNKVWVWMEFGSSQSVGENAGIKRILFSQSSEQAFNEDMA